MSNENNNDIVGDVIKQIKDFDWDEIKRELEEEADLEELNDVELKH